MAPFTVLEDHLEDELHAKRLLRVEERPLERIKNRLLGPNTPANRYLARAAASVPVSVQANGDAPLQQHTIPDPFPPEEHNKFLKDLQRFREDVILDFAAFEASIARIQFLRNANEKERQRYAAEKVKIEATAQDVREDTTGLKIRLDASQRTLEIRKGYDILAENITRDARLKPRDEQHINIERLKVEIEELEREGVDLGHAWIERREQLAKLVEEGKKLRRIVRDEKELEQEDKGEMEEDGDEDKDDDENMLGVEGQRDQESNVGTPRPTDDAPTPLPALHESGGMTPRSAVGEDETATSHQHLMTDQNGQETTMHGTGMAGAVGETTQTKPEDEMDIS